MTWWLCSLPLKRVEISVPNISSSSFSKLENKRFRELKRLACFINYDLKGGQSSRGKGKGRGPTTL